MSKKIVVLLFIFIGLIQSCNTTEPPPPGEKITLTLILEDVSSIEAWIKLTTNNLQLPTTITLKQSATGGNSVTQDIVLSYADTVIYIDSLLPNTTYSFLAAIQPSNHTNEVKSNVLTVTTMDTTSHNFTWQTWTFGEHSSSVLYDVAIINEDCIWAVGEIYLNDSLGNPDPNAYNAVHWDGTEWIPFRIMFYTICGQQNRTPYPASSIFAFSESDIWVGMLGSQVARLNGTTQVATYCLPVSVRKLWGVDNQNIYAVGVNGQIARYNGRVWTRIESGTDADLSDVWGTPDGNEIWACGWSNQSGRVAILKIKGNGVESIWDSQTNTTLNIYRGTLLNSLWANGNGEFIFVGGQVLRHSLIDKRIVRLEWIRYPNRSKVLELGNYGYRIKGSNKNNIAVAGDAAMIWHYNGTSWHKYSELHSENDRLYGLAVNNDFIVAVGKRFEAGVLGGALLIIGRR
ncbi:MAG: glucosyl transferase [Bacteroidetes bacterium]|nr:glucosyl transferase [Bacteroidota bacterium]